MILRILAGAFMAMGIFTMIIGALLLGLQLVLLAAVVGLI